MNIPREDNNVFNSKEKNFHYYISDLVPEEEKLTDEYLFANCRNIINMLVNSNNKQNLNTAYSYFSCERSELEYKSIQDNYGLGSVIKIPFIPIVKARINALVGQLLQRTNTVTITSTDEHSINEIDEEKKNEALNKTLELINKKNQELAQRIKQSEQNVEEAKSKGSEKQNAIYEHEIEKISLYLETEWKPLVEIAAHHFLNYFNHNANTDLLNKSKRLLENLLWSGTQHYRIYIKEIGQDPIIDVIDSNLVYYYKKSGQTYVNECDRICWIEYMTKTDILNRYSYDMTEEEMELIDMRKVGYGYNMNPNDANKANIYTNSFDNINDTTNHYTYIPVYHTEWISNNRVTIHNQEQIDNYLQTTNEADRSEIVRMRKDRYKCSYIYGIGYFDYGKDNNVIRSIDNPAECKLSVNGVGLDDYGTPFSLIMKTKQIQDIYDLTMFKLYNVIHASGINSSKIVLEHIPAFYTGTPEERLMKHQAYLKQGLDIISISQEGMKDFNNYGATSNVGLDNNAVQGFVNTLNFLEATLNTITGIPKEMLGTIEERQAVGNVQMTTIKSTVVTMPIFHTHNLLMKQLFTDLLNMCKLTYEKGKRVNYIIGGMKQSFLLKEDGMWADYNVHVSMGTEEAVNLEKSKGLVVEYAKAQLIKPIDGFALMNTNSVSELNQLVKSSMKKQEENQINQLNQQLQEAQKQIEQLTKQIEGIDKSQQEEAKQRLELDKQRLQAEIKYKQDSLAQQDKEFVKEVELKEKQINAEIIQMYDNNPNNDEPKNII